jgi:S1-C subfamily serine protease
LKALAKKVQIPAIITLDKLGEDEIIDFIGAKIKNLNTAGERSATGMDDTRGVLVLEVTSGTGASDFLQTNDVILFLNNKRTNNLRDLLEARMSVIGSNTEIIVFRNQKEVKSLIKTGDKE